MRGETAKRGSRQKPGRQEGDPGQLTGMTNLGQHIKGQDKDKGHLLCVSLGLSSHCMLVGRQEKMHQYKSVRGMLQSHFKKLPLKTNIRLQGIPTLQATMDLKLSQCSLKICQCKCQVSALRAGLQSKDIPLYFIFPMQRHSLVTPV